MIGGALGEDGLHAGIEDLDVMFSFGLQVFLAEQVAVVVEGVVFEGLPEGHPAGSAEQI